LIVKKYLSIFSAGNQPIDFYSFFSSSDLLVVGFFFFSSFQHKTKTKHIRLISSGFIFSLTTINCVRFGLGIRFLFLFYFFNSTIVCLHFDVIMLTKKQVRCVCVFGLMEERETKDTFTIKEEGDEVMI
jgi:hypothetical protein